MNSLIRGIKLDLLRKNLKIATAVRNVTAWNQDWKPGPYPKTEEERIAAAKKYGLHPKDYQPYPDDGTGFGDYPMFEPVSMEARDPYEHYDIPEYRRNWQEVIHLDYDVYTEDRYNTAERDSPPLHMQVLCYVGLMTAFFLAMLIAEDHKMIWPLMKQQFPKDGETHYTFEPDN